MKAKWFSIGELPGYHEVVWVCDSSGRVDKGLRHEDAWYTTDFLCTYADIVWWARIESPSPPDMDNDFDGAGVA